MLPLEGISVHEFPDQLKYRKRFTGSGGHQQQNAIVALSKLPQGFGDSHFLIGADLLSRDLVDMKVGGKCAFPNIPINCCTHAGDDLFWTRGGVGLRRRRRAG